MRPMPTPSTRPFRGALAVALALLAALVGGTARATDAGKPTLAVLRTAADGDDKAREDRFILELKLGLDGFDIALVEPGAAGFTALPLKDKLDEVRARAEPLHAAATIWLESASPRTVLLNVVALSTGRAFIRVVEVEDGPSAERELAVAADELLGQLYMLSAPPRPAPVQASVEAVVAKAAALAAPRRVELDVATYFDLGGALYHYEAAWLRLGGGVAVELRTAGGALLRAGFTVVAGPFADPRDGSLSGFGLSPEIAFGYLWHARRVRLGPVAGAAAARSTVALALGRGEAQTTSWWSFRGSLGLELRIDLAPSVAVFVEPRVGASTHTRRFERVSDGSTALRTPILDGGATLGVCYNF